MRPEQWRAMDYVFTPPTRPSLPVIGTEARFPVRRVYCVGRNYSAHMAEMGHTEPPDPFFFTKPPDAAFVPEGPVPYPLHTRLLHHEVELVVALERGGAEIAAEDVDRYIFGYTVGIDLTRRDLQSEAREKKRPWDMAKGFTSAAPCAPIRPVGDCFPEGIRGQIRLAVNDVVRQDGRLEDMILGVGKILEALSRFDRLAAGDLVFTGTPAGVGELRPGDNVWAEIDGVAKLELQIAE